MDVSRAGDGSHHVFPVCRACQIRRQKKAPAAVRPTMQTTPTARLMHWKTG